VLNWKYLQANEQACTGIPYIHPNHIITHIIFVNQYWLSRFLGLTPRSFPDCRFVACPVNFKLRIAFDASDETILGDGDGGRHCLPRGGSAFGDVVLSWYSR